MEIAPCKVAGAILRFGKNADPPRRSAAKGCAWSHKPQQLRSSSSPKGWFPTAVGNTEYGQLSRGRKRPDGVRWEQKTKLPSLPPPPEPIPRGRTRNRSAQTKVDHTAQDKQGGGLEHPPQAGVLWPFSGVQGLAPWALFASFLPR